MIKGLEIIEVQSQNFFETLACNMGFVVQEFTSRGKAIQWLQKL